MTPVPKPRGLRSPRLAAFAALGLVITSAHSCATAPRPALPGPATPPPAEAPPPAAADKSRLVDTLIHQTTDRQQAQARATRRGDPACDPVPVIAATFRPLIYQFKPRNLTPPEDAVRALTALHQLVLEVGRDSDLVPDTFIKFHSVGLPVSLEEMGVPGDDASMSALAVKLSRGSCRLPFDSSAKAWRLALQKVWNWGAKYNGTRDTAVLARELLATPEVVNLAPVFLRHRQPRNVLVLGHSYTMERHWSSPSAFVPVAAAILRGLNAGVEVTQLAAGGLDAAWAEKEFLPKLLATHPAEVHLVVTTVKPSEKKALGRIVARLKQAGIQPCVFDAIDFHDPYQHDPRHARLAVAIARKAGARIIEVQGAYDRLTSRKRLRDLSLDGVHMTEPYHRFMAVQWLRALAEGIKAPPGSRP